MQFGNGDSIWLLALPLLAAVLAAIGYNVRQNRFHAFADQEVLAQIYTLYTEEKRRARGRALLLSLVALLLSIALLRPQFGFTWKESKRAGVDIVVAVDVSQSMRAQDVAPNRLERARREILDLLEHLQGDRLGLVAFAGTAFIESPLTLDYSTFRLFLESLTTDLIPVNGTNVQSALEKSLEGLGIKTGQMSEKSKRERAIILITDGEDLEGDYSRIREIAKGAGVRIYVMGIGTPDGAPIPLEGGGYKKDKQGNVIITRLNEAELITLANETGGIYVQSISSDADTNALYERGIKKTLQDAALSGGRAKRWNEYYQLPLLLALFLLVLGPLYNLAKEFEEQEAAVKVRRRMRAVKIKNAASVVLLISAPILNPGVVGAESPERIGHDAASAYEQGEFSKAAEDFSKGKKLENDDFRFSLGEGASYYRLKRFDEAERAFREAALKAKEPNQKAGALYNGGNALVQQEKLEEAIKRYEEALKINPTDQEIVDNLAYAKLLLEQKKKEQQQNQNQQQNKEQNQSDKNQDQNKENKQNQSNQKQDSDKQSENKNEKEDQKNDQNQESSQKQQDQQKDQKQDQKQDQQQNQSQDQKQDQSSQGQSKEQQSKEDEQQSSSQNQNQSQEDKDEQSKNDQDQKNPDQPPDQQAEQQKEEKPEQGSQENDKNQSGEEESPAPQNQNRGKTEDLRYDQGAATLDSIEEKRGLLLKYRLREGLKELEDEHKPYPTHDW